MKPAKRLVRLDRYKKRRMPSQKKSACVMRITIAVRGGFAYYPGHLANRGRLWLNIIETGIVQFNVSRWS